MEFFDAIARSIDNHSTVNLIGLEGPPYAGKTTFASNLGLEMKARSIPDPMQFEPRLAQYSKIPWPDDRPDLILERQLAFLNVEVMRCSLAVDLKNFGYPVIMDRTLISLLAYLYVRVKLRPYQSEVLDLYLGHCHSALKAETLVIPEKFYYLQTPTEECVTRSQRAIREGNRGCDDTYIIARDTVDALHDFYRGVFSRIKPCRVTYITG